ncbi:MAG: UbiA family prenyltransferase [Desulfobacterium sp.]|nr:UbiA family prenyltransferase [Desulfobacterium sp.]
MSSRLFDGIGVGKPLLCLALTFSSLLGIAFDDLGHLDRFLKQALAAFCLFFGSACLNNFQDRHGDKLLTRTRGRALPLGRLAPLGVLVQAVTFLGLGLAGLFWVGGGPAPCVWALVGVVLYNGVYTPLKSRTVWALVPGALSGAVPVAMGWSGAVGGGLPPGLWAVMGLMVVWQFPHAWLVLLSHPWGEPIPLLALFRRDQLERILLVWISLWGSGLAMFVLFKPDLVGVVAWIMGANGLGVVLFFGVRLWVPGGGSARLGFRVFNASLVVFMAALMADGLVG